MIDLKSFAQAIEQIGDEKGISKDKILEVIEMALAAAYKRDYGKRAQIIHAKIDPASGKVIMKQIKIAVDESMLKTDESDESEEEHLTEIKEVEVFEEGVKKVKFNPDRHIMIAEAKKIRKDVKPGDEIEFPIEYHEEFGRIAAQTAKQVIIQRIREAERDAVFEEFKGKEGGLIHGIIQRIEGKNVYLDIGRTIAVLPYDEQIPRERYSLGTRIRAIIIHVEKNLRGPGIILSRSHPKLLEKLFEMEVPEIGTGAVEIKAIAREAGSRSKIAVSSSEKGIDPVGSLVGQKGIRVSTVINELGGEKIDVLEWSANVEEFIAASFSPAKVIKVELNQKNNEAVVTVSDDQLSLAIGRGGQNVRLAAKLTAWRIDVVSEKGEVQNLGLAADKEKQGQKKTEFDQEEINKSK